MFKVGKGGVGGERKEEGQGNEGREEDHGEESGSGARRETRKERAQI